MNKAGTHNTVGYGEPTLRRPQLSTAPALRATSQPPVFRPKYKTELRDPEALLPEDPTTFRKRRYRFSFWYNNDFRLLMAFLLTAAFAAYIYQSLKGS